MHTKDSWLCQHSGMGHQSLATATRRSFHPTELLARNTSYNPPLKKTHIEQSHIYRHWRDIIVLTPPPVQC